MTAHIAVNALTGDAETPATLSRRVMTDLLRRDMGFDGLLFTDALDMAAIDAGHPRGEAAVRAVEARSEEHTSELQSQSNLVCRLLLEKKKNKASTDCIGFSIYLFL